MKNEKSGFSLIEVLIALIIISLVTSAMAPVISKKLIATGAFITVKGGGSAFCDAGQYLEDSGSCADCPKGFFCVNNEKKQCLEGQVSDVAQSACTTCENGFYANETQDKCIKCEAGSYCTQGKKTTCPDGSTSTEGQYFCTSCPEGYYCQNGEQKSCESKFTNCTTCTQSACLSCKKGYDLESGRCTLKGFSQDFCDTLGDNLLYLTASQNDGTAACVTRANVGDSYVGGPDLNKIKTEAGITVVNSGSTCGSETNYSGKCCWLGNNVGTTASDCGASGNGDSTYSGCKRTVCTWAAAKAACENWAPNGSGTKGKWRLPTRNELSVWANNISTIQKKQGKNGLELCDYYSGYGSVRCNYNSYACSGAESNYCHPTYVWSSDEYGTSPAYGHYLSQGSFDGWSSYSKSSAFSARCVLTEDTYMGKKPTSLRSQADCDYFGKDLKFINSSQGGPACVTKANVGDTSYGGPPVKNVGGITVVGSSTACGSYGDDSIKCCWTGSNGNTCSSAKDGSRYSGCSRTVCTWEAANAACKNFAPTYNTKGKWRLPTTGEVSSWARVFDTINSGDDGLRLCAEGTYYYDSKFAICSLGTTSSYCTIKNDSYSGQCQPDTLWADDRSEYEAYYFWLINDQINDSYNSDSKTKPRSARCVLDDETVRSLRF